MTQELQSKFWKIKLFAALVVAGTIVTTFIQAASAQITPDNTLGNESSRVLPDTTVRGAAGTLIDGGATRGVNLFHSFSQFNVGNGERVYFANPTGINNILTRVTGNSASNIFGTLGVDGNANLFLLNPNGIVFGQNAQLDVSGSFFATTANSFVWENGLQYSAVNPEAPPLLTVNLTPGLQFGVNSGDITSNANLAVGGNLTLAGGNLNLQGQFASQGLDLEARDTANLGTILAPGISVNVTAGNKITTTGQINTSINRGRGGDIQLTSGIGGIDTRGGDITAGSDNGDGGNITLSATGDILTAGVRSFVSPGGIGNGGNISITSTNGKIDTTLGNINSSTALGLAGNISLNANGDITTGNVGSFVSAGGIGNGGNITITSTNGDINTTGFVNSSAFGAFLDLGTGNQLVGGIAGDISLNAKGDITTRDVGSFVSAGGIGNGGNITITSTNGDINTTGFVNSSAFGAFLDLGTGNQLVGGIAGDISLNAKGDITTRDVGSYISAGGIGKAGHISIISQDGEINTTGGNIASSSEGGLSGDIYLEAKNKISTRNLRSFSNLGNGGNITILSKNGEINTTAGSINSAGGWLEGSNNPNNFGQSGNISLKAFGDIFTGEIKSAGNLGSAGYINIVTENGNINLRGDLRSEIINGNGIAGNITLRARGDISNDVVKDAEGRIISSTPVKIEASSNNDINNNYSIIDIQSFQGSVILDRVKVSTTNAGSGLAGDIFIDADKNIEITNSNRSNGADIRGIESQGKLGNIFIGKYSEVDRLVIDNSLLANTTSGSSNGGNIDIKTASVSLNNSALFAATLGSGKAGMVKVAADNSISLDHSYVSTGVVPKEFRGTGSTGSGNDITFEAKSISLNNRSVLEANTYGAGNAGDIKINADLIKLDTVSLLLNNTYGEGKAGNVDIKTQNLTIIGGSEVLSQTYGKGDAGDIMINPLNDKASSSVTISGVAPFQKDEQGHEIILDENNNLTGGFSSGLFASTENNVQNPTPTTGAGGDITVNTGTLNIQDSGAISVRSRSRGDAGKVDINVDTLNITGGGQILTPTFGSGKSGEINITATGDINISGVDTEYGNRFQKIYSALFNAFREQGLTEEEALQRAFQRTQFTVDTIGNSASSGFAASGLVSASFSNGSAGNIDINASSVKLQQKAEIFSSTFGTGDTGKVTITTSGTNGGTVTLDNANIFSTIENGANVPVTDENNDKVGIQINTGELKLKNGAQLQTLVRGSENNPIAIPAKGNAGNIFIIADEVTLEGKNDSGFSSAIFSNLGTGAEGKAGNISILADKVSLAGGTRISSDTSGTGDAGTIVLLANDSVSLNGSGTTISTTADSSNLPGNAGGIGIIAPIVKIENGAEIKVDSERPVQFSNNTKPLIPQSSSPTQQNSDTVNRSNNMSQSSGNSPQAGIVLVFADRLFLNDGKITATSQAIDGGNIFLNVRELLLMRNNSLISAQARGQGNGGNVFINTLEGYRGFVIALNDGSKQPPYTGNDIIASAENGDGGNVVINTQSLFGFGVRKANSPNQVIQRQTVADENEEYERYSRASNQTNDIDVSSKTGLQGEVVINTLVVDPSSGLISLPENPTDPSKQIVPACDAGDGQFTNTGRGGLPPNPNQPLGGDNVWEDMRVNVSGGQSQVVVTGDYTEKSARRVVSIVPATSWVMDGKGQVMLVNQAGNDAGLKGIPGVSSSCRPVR
ncbi:two-partner secretion domain-containing protein [Calothrix sp. NIES-3974]|uniref:two-partner secretion domain-containing protein n=1 Tax=Calothrix sp. NIES-3974 TaxID=2005462 RepID=UPI000B61D2D2|nr:filamentous hemagglutinin N-terminal domain-containing protein [Calothrix sp. NIES-3974]BAZ04457.1 filamentous hemagglutinin outer membrane protein [Calothrix sp. NIES-3974]